MNKKIYTIVAAAALMLGFTACDDDWTPQLEDEGTLKLSSMGVDVNTAESRADADVAGFTVVIKNAEKTVQQWIYSEMPEIITLPVGDYTVEVYSHQVQKQDWEKPYYIGSKAFKIAKSTVTEIGTVTCSFASLKVTIGYHPDLYPHLGDDCKVTVITNDAGKLEYAKDETRAGYFEVVNNSTTIVATLEGTIDGKASTIQRTFTDVTPGSHYHIVYAVKGTDVIIYEGYIDPTAIGVDTSVTNVNTGANVTIEEEVIANPGLKPGTEGEIGGDPDPGSDKIIFTSETLSFTQPNSTSASPAAVNIYAEAGFAHLYVKISSDSQSFMQSVSEMLPTEFDLATVTGDTATALESIGLPVGPYPADQTSLVFDITDFTPILGGFTGTHSFALNVVDNEGNENSINLVFYVP